MTLNYKRLGEGTPLIILHGLFGSLDNWMTLAKKWAEQYEVWLVDQRNHGQSPHSDAFSYSVMAEDLQEFIEEHHIQSPILLGHSMGGKTVMEYAIQHPNSAQKIIVVDIAPVSYNVHHYPIIEALESVDLATVSSRKEADAFLSHKISDFGTRQFLLKNLYWKEKGQLSWRFNLEVLKKEIVPISEWDISEGICEKESLFIKGEKSDYILPSYAHSISIKFPNYHLVELQNAGHWVHAEAPESFFKAVNEFMKH